MTKNDVHFEQSIIEKAEKFVTNVREEMSKYPLSQIYNTDQMGVELELHSNRTLSHMGEKITKGLVKSHNAMTHSYTVQPTINCSGDLLSPVFLCLKEATGRISECKHLISIFNDLE